ncbi:MAG: hypothetical protein AAGB18_05860 [Pseudomonadota bacterium]
MVLKPIFLAGVLLMSIGAAQAQHASQGEDCASASGPVISEGMPGANCARDTGVIVNRGPEVAPEPSEAAPAYRPRFHTAPASSGSEAYDPWGQRSRIYLHPSKRHARRAASPGFRIVYRDDNVYLRIGNGPHRGSKHRPTRGHVPILVKETAGAAAAVGIR